MDAQLVKSCGSYNPRMEHIHQLIVWTLQALTILHAALVLGFSVRILLRENLLPSARMAWLMVLFIAPYLGVVLYLLFGEISLGRSIHSRHDEIFRKVHSVAGSVLGSCDQVLPAHVETEYRSAFRAASIDGFETTIGNRAELLADDRIARAKLIEDIDRATESVQCLYYIWLDDQTGVEVADREDWRRANQSLVLGCFAIEPLAVRQRVS
ncbi:MAG: PLDc N-terminal domain-containing protein [Aureliella sp.]